MSSEEHPGARWRKSRYSNAQAECVEVGRAAVGQVAVRDTKDRTGAVLAFPVGAWRAFTGTLR